MRFHQSVKMKFLIPAILCALLLVDYSEGNNLFLIIFKEYQEKD